MTPEETQISVEAIMHALDAVAAANGLTTNDLMEITTLAAINYATREKGPFGATRFLRGFADQVDANMMASAN